MVTLLTRSWWAIALRGLAAILFGVLALVWPGLTLEALILLFGAYALVDGVLSAAGAILNSKHDRTWPWFLLAGLAAVVAGILAFAYPGLTAIILVYFIAARALVVGIIEVVAAVALRREISDERFLILKGIVSVLFGAALLVAPGAGALALVLVIGIYAIFVGLLLLLAAFRLRRWRGAASGA